MNEKAPSYEDRIRQAYGGLSPTYARMANFLLDCYEQAAFANATELAHMLDVDPATVVRFAQRLGYPGYPELQHEIQEKVRCELLREQQLAPGTCASAADEAIAELARGLELSRRSFPLEEAKALICELDKATRVILLADGPASSAAKSLASHLEAAGHTVQLAGGSPSELARSLAGARKGDLALAFEVAGETDFITRAMAEAQRAGVTTAAIVAAPSSQVARHASIVLTAHATPSPEVGQLLLGALVYSLAQMLAQARPGRFGDLQGRVATLTQRLTGASSQPTHQTSSAPDLERPAVVESTRAD